MWIQKGVRGIFDDSTRTVSGDDDLGRKSSATDAEADDVTAAVRVQDGSAVHGADEHKPVHMAEPTHTRFLDMVVGKQIVRMSHDILHLQHDRKSINFDGSIWN